MFHPGLAKLICLQWRGGFRRFLRSLRTIRGVFQLVFTLALFGQTAFSLYFSARFTNHGTPFGGSIQSLISDLLALGMFALTSYIVLFSTGEAAVHFTSSEVAFLFPAPITRRQLFAYKLVASLLGVSVVSLMFTLISLPPISFVIPRFIAVLATFFFIQLLAMNVAFTRQVLKGKMHLLIRRILGFLIACIVIVAFSQTTQSATNGDLDAYVKGFQASTAGTAMLAPFQVFVRAIRATDWISFGLNGSILILVDSVLLVLAFKMDALSLEAAFAFSEKMTARMKQMQSKGVWQALGQTKSEAARRRIPMLPFWAGIGPVLWQRANTTVRSSPKLLLIPIGAIAIAAFVSFRAGSSNSATATAPFVGIGILVYTSFLISLTMQNDIDRVGYFKSLPISSRSIVIGDLIGFPLLLAAIQSLFLVGEACIYSYLAPGLLSIACLTPLLNFLLFGIDKLVFYVYPTRLAKGAPGDFQASGKQMIFMTFKMLMLGCAVMIGAIAALPGLLIFHSSIVAFVSVVIALVVECMILVPLLTYAFDRFDPGSAQVS